MTTQVITLKRGRVAAGLRWVALGHGKPKHVLREAVASFGIDNPTHGVFVMSATGDGPSYGAVVPPGAPPTAQAAYSGAAWMASTVTEATLLIQRTSNRDNYWWVLFVRPGVISANGDLVLSESQAGERIDQVLHDAYSQGEPIRVLCGEDAPSTSVQLGSIPWESALEQEVVSHHTRRVAMDFAGFAGDGAPPKTARIVQVAGVRRVYIYGGLVLAALVTAGMGAMLWMKRQKEAAELAKLQAELAQQQIAASQVTSVREARITQAVADALRDDTASPLPSRWLASCADVAFDTHGEIAGWRISGIECAQGAPSVRIGLERRDRLAVNAGLAAYAEARDWSVSIDPSGATASVSVPLDGGDARVPMKHGELPDVTGVVWMHGTQFQQFQAAFKGSQIQVGAPSTRMITYLDPEKEHSENASERFQPVPPERGYQVGQITINGAGLWILPALRIDAPYFSVKRISIQPAPLSAGDKITVEVQYVVSNF